MLHLTVSFIVFLNRWFLYNCDSNKKWPFFFPEENTFWRVNIALWLATWTRTTQNSWKCHDWVKTISVLELKQSFLSFNFYGKPVNHFCFDNDVRLHTIPSLLTKTRTDWTVFTSDKSLLQRMIHRYTVHYSSYVLMKCWCKTFQDNLNVSALWIPNKVYPFLLHYLSLLNTVCFCFFVRFSLLLTMLLCCVRFDKTRILFKECQNDMNKKCLPLLWHLGRNATFWLTAWENNAWTEINPVRSS